MKKLILVLLSCHLLGNIVYAQLNPNVKDVTQKNGSKVIDAINGKPVPDFKVTPQPNFGGTPETPRLLNGKLVASFPLKNVSIIIPTGRIIYLKYCNSEFPYEVVYTKESQGTSNINLEDVCEVRSDVLTAITVRFNGISTGIHNDDCKRVFGKITVKLIETSADGLESFLPVSTGTLFSAGDRFTYVPLNIYSAESRTRGIRDYVFSDARVQNLSTNIVRQIRGGGEDIASFSIGSTAWRQGRIKMIVVNDIKSAHKMNNTAAYFDNVHMVSPVTETIPFNISFPYQNGGNLLNSRNNSIIFGPYAGVGVPRNPIAATGGDEHVHDFRAHFSFTFPAL